MSRTTNPLPALIAGAVTVAGFCTVLVEGGWWIWLPVITALGVAATGYKRISRS